MSDNNKVGVIIVRKRARVGMLGSIRNPLFCIWIQQIITKRGEGVRATVRRMIRKNEVEE